MVFALRQVLRRRDLRGLSPLDVSGRILLRVGEAFGATEIDRSVEESAFNVFVVNLFASHGAGLIAVTFAQKFAFDGLCRMNVSFVLSLLDMFVMRERLQRQRRDDD
jgi:hypothetical protein